MAVTMTRQEVSKRIGANKIAQLDYLEARSEVEDAESYYIGANGIRTEAGKFPPYAWLLDDETLAWVNTGVKMIVETKGIQAHLDTARKVLASAEAALMEVAAVVLPLADVAAMCSAGLVLSLRRRTEILEMVYNMDLMTLPDEAEVIGSRSRKGELENVGANNNRQAA